MVEAPGLLIYIATKNRPKLLLNTLNQLVTQISKNDLVIVSDASDKLDEPKIIEFFQINSSNFHYHRNSTKGVTANRNYGLNAPVIKKISYWCFFDDDLNIQPDYLQNVRIAISTIDSKTAITGYLNTDIPNSPNWLGFYRKPALINGMLLMPHSVGTWIPVHNYPKFSYQSEHLYGNDELELRDYLLRNQIKIKFVPELLISHPKHEYATKNSLSEWTRAKVRIQQNVNSMKRNNKSYFKITFFVFITTLHYSYYQFKLKLKHLLRILPKIK